MKSKWIRVLSMLLILSLAVSLSTVFASAEEATAALAEDEETEEAARLIYYRTYDEGWYLSNGVSITTKDNIFAIDSEVTIDYKRNYFWRFTLNSSGDGYGEISMAGSPNNQYVIEFDVKSDDYCDFGRIMYMRTTGNSNPSLFAIKENKAYAFSYEDESNYLFDVSNTWHTVSIVLDGEYYKDVEDKSGYHVKVYVDGELKIETYREVEGSLGAQFLRVGNTQSLNEELYGTSYCLDNFKIYGGVNKVIEITEDMGHGTNVNTSGSLGVVIEGADDTAEKLAGVLAMKVGVDHYYTKGERLPLVEGEDGTAYGAPFELDGHIMMPLEPLLSHMGVSRYIHPDGKFIDISTGVSATYLSVGKSSATVDGKAVDLLVAPGYATAEDGTKYLVVAMDDVEKLFAGWYITYDEMGLIVFSEYEDIVNRDKNLNDMMGLMKEFIFDYITPEEAYEDAKAGTDGFQHPYILADEERFDFLRAAYQYYQDMTAQGKKESDVDDLEQYTLGSYVSRLVSSGLGTYRTYAAPVSVTVNENGLEVKDFSEYVGMAEGVTYFNQSYMSNGGYDVGGRSYPVDRTDKLQTLAFAYQITGDIKLVKLANDIAYKMEAWTHWGHGHFLNCADAVAPYAVYYDWCYQANEQLGEETGEDINARLAYILYEKGVYPGWRSSMGLPLDHYRAQGDASNYTNRDNNWNAVCSSGMIMGCLAILGEENVTNYETVKEHATFVISNNLECLMRVGLKQYAPDGAYIEGPGYWAYGTNCLFRLCKTLDLAMGSNYGLMDCWGMENTCYYACSIESSDFWVFNYNDCNNQSMSTYWLFYAGEALNDENLIAIRKTHLKNGKSISIFDMVSWPMESGVGDNADVPLDYADYYLEIYTARSGWDKGEMFVGIMAGDNNVTHGQLDSGSFVYHNSGNIWFYDVGTEDYNVYGFWSGAHRYRYYVMKPEGNNTLAISSLPNKLPYGQELNSTPYLESFYSNDYGSYAIYEMTEAFGGAAMSWKRGVLVTNDRNTVVIQDEVAMPDMHSIYWFGHYNNSYVSNITISDDGRTAYLSKTDATGNKVYLRATIVSDLSRFKFEIWDCYTFIHTQTDTGTHTPDFAKTSGNLVAEKDRSNYGKLVIKAEGALSFNVAVVLEAVSEESGKEVGYEWTDMRLWEPVSDTRDDGTAVVESKRRNSNPKRTEITSGMMRARLLLEEEGSYSDKIDDMYRILTDVNYVIAKYRGYLDGAQYQSAVEEYNASATTYNAYATEVNGVSNIKIGIAASLLGVG